MQVDKRCTGAAITSSGGPPHMKTVLTLLLATVATTAFAYDEGRITITLASNKAYTIFINGRQHFATDNQLVIDNIRPGTHSIKIYQSGRSSRNSHRNERHPRSDRFEELVYSTNVYLKPSYHVDIMINRFGKALVDEQLLNNRSRWEDDDWRNDNNNRYNRAMPEYDFNQLKLAIRNAWFASDKLRLARSAFERNYFETIQVKQVLQLFASDSEKLELAKAVFRNTLDQGNYFQLYEVFSFQSSKDELERFTRNFRH